MANDLLQHCMRIDLPGRLRDPAEIHQHRGELCIEQHDLAVIHVELVCSDRIWVVVDICNRTFGWWGVGVRGVMRLGIVPQ